MGASQAEPNRPVPPGSDRAGPSLVLCTDAFPYGTQEAFVALELPYLLDVFPSITILPRTYGDRTVAREVPPGVRVLDPVFTSTGRAARMWQGFCNTGPVRRLLAAFIREQFHRSHGPLIRGLEAVATARRLLSRPAVKQLLKEPSRDTLWYFYWGAGCAWSIPFLPEGIPCMARFHSYDIYAWRPESRGCMPFQRDIARRIQLGACISEHGQEHLQQEHPDQADTFRVHRLGVPAMPRAQASEDGVFRMLTCARMVPLKRLELLAQAVVRLPFPVEWRHLGDGPCRENVERIMASGPEHIRYLHEGQVDYQQVRACYRDHPVDVLAVTSTLEGVPVVVMEALGAGVPVLATDVGGVAELVDDQVGRLLPANLDVDQLASELCAIQAEPAQRKIWRDNALRRWREKADAEQTFRVFAQTCRSILFASRSGSEGHRVDRSESCAQSKNPALAPSA